MAGAVAGGALFIGSGLGAVFSTRDAMKNDELLVAQHVDDARTWLNTPAPQPAAPIFIEECSREQLTANAAHGVQRDFDKAAAVTCVYTKASAEYKSRHDQDNVFRMAYYYPQEGGLWMLSTIFFGLMSVSGLAAGVAGATTLVRGAVDIARHNAVKKQQPKPTI